jgi:small subunit ribosomal protein S3Ae
MAVGKNPILSKGKKGGKKKIIDPLSKKEWFDFRAPVPFSSKSFGKTCITKSSGTSTLLKEKLFTKSYFNCKQE